MDIQVNHIELDLPTANEITPDLFSHAADELWENHNSIEIATPNPENPDTPEVELNGDIKKEDELSKTRQLASYFDVDSFLLVNNLEYVPLDSLIRSTEKLAITSDNNLISQIYNDYDEYSDICNQLHSVGSEPVIQLQSAKDHVENFEKQLKKEKDIELKNTRQIVSSTLAYLKSLDVLNSLLSKHSQLSKHLQAYKRLVNSFHNLLTNNNNIQTTENKNDIQARIKIIENSENLLKPLINSCVSESSVCHDLINSLMSVGGGEESKRLRTLLSNLRDTDATLRSSLDLLIEVCLNDTTKYGSLANIILNAVNAQSIN